MTAYSRRAFRCRLTLVSRLLSAAGHFAAWEQPELLAKEVIEFFLVDVGLGSGSPKL